jgi:hypothetical protein
MGHSRVIASTLLPTFRIGRLVLVAAQGGLQDLPGDRSGGCAAEPCADEHHGDGDPRILRRCEGYEPTPIVAARPRVV